MFPGSRASQRESVDSVLLHRNRDQNGAEVTVSHDVAQDGKAFEFHLTNIMAAAELLKPIVLETFKGRRSVDETDYEMAVLTSIFD